MIFRFSLGRLRTGKLNQTPGLINKPTWIIYFSEVIIEGNCIQNTLPTRPKIHSPKTWRQLWCCCARKTLTCADPFLTAPKLAAGKGRTNSRNFPSDLYLIGRGTPPELGDWETFRLRWQSDPFNLELASWE